MERLRTLLKDIDGLGYKAYKRLAGSYQLWLLADGRSCAGRPFCAAFAHQHSCCGGAACGVLVGQNQKDGGDQPDAGEKISEVSRHGFSTTVPMSDRCFQIGRSPLSLVPKAIVKNVILGVKVPDHIQLAMIDALKSYGENAE